MIRTTSLVLAAGAASLLAGCAAPAYYSPVEVTRFVAPTPDAVPRGPIGVRPAPGQDPQDPAYAVYQTAVIEALDRNGFQVSSDVAPFMALIDVERWVIEGGQRRGPVSVGGGASTGSFGSGVGLGIGIDLSGPDPERIETQLSVSIRPSAGGQAVWEGRARFTATDNSEFADPQAAAARMAEALFQGFPGNSGETIEVE
jgi:hypothetical protein